MPRTITATRYLEPLRDGSSLPALIEANDNGLYVLKLRSAGQGLKALVAELLAGELARLLALPVPEIVFVELDPALAQSHPETLIRNLVRDSGGLNLALDYLPGSTMFNAKTAPFDAELASRIVWFDALVGNPDRTSRNPNLLMWHGRGWLIDHGAALYFHHQWEGYMDRATDPFIPIRNHVLLPWATQLNKADEHMRAHLTPEAIERVVELIPDNWLETSPMFSDASAQRRAYGNYLLRRLQAQHLFPEGLGSARA